MRCDVLRLTFGVRCSVREEPGGTCVRAEPLVNQQLQQHSTVLAIASALHEHELIRAPELDRRLPAEGAAGRLPSWIEEYLDALALSARMVRLPSRLASSRETHASSSTRVRDHTSVRSGAIEVTSAAGRDAFAEATISDATAISADPAFWIVKYRLPIPTGTPALSITPQAIVCTPSANCVVSMVKRASGPSELARPGTYAFTSGRGWL